MKRSLFTRGFVCAFPGVGKSSIYHDASDYNLTQGVNVEDWNSLEFRDRLNRIKKLGMVPVFDNDSSGFDKRYFPQNMIHNAMLIKRNYSEFLYFASTHETVRMAFKEAGLKYDLVFPQRELKNEYIERYEQRGSSPTLIKLMDEKWDEFIDSCENDQTIGIKYRLESGQYLSDVLI